MEPFSYASSNKEGSIKLAGKRVTVFRQQPELILVWHFKSFSFFYKVSVLGSLPAFYPSLSNPIIPIYYSTSILYHTFITNIFHICYKIINFLLNHHSSGRILNLSAILSNSSANFLSDVLSSYLFMISCLSFNIFASSKYILLTLTLSSSLVFPFK